MFRPSPLSIHSDTRRRPCPWLGFRRTEALFFLPLSFIHRFVGREGQENALSALFDSDDWREAIPLEGGERSAFLLELFERQLQSQGQVEHVRSFQLRTRDRNAYRLVFATGHERGLDIIKQAMWSVDPVAGTRYVARTEIGQEVLFQSSVDTEPLINALRAAFGSEWFTVKEASRVTLLRTPFLHGSHLKRLTLVPIERSGLIEVERPAGKRAGTFTDDVRLRFLNPA